MIAVFGGNCDHIKTRSVIPALAGVHTLNLKLRRSTVTKKTSTERRVFGRFLGPTGSLYYQVLRITFLR